MIITCLQLLKHKNNMYCYQSTEINAIAAGKSSAVVYIYKPTMDKLSIFNLRVSIWLLFFDQISVIEFSGKFPVQHIPNELGIFCGM